MSNEVPWRRAAADTLVLAVYVQPGAKRTAVAGTHGEDARMQLKIRLAAPPVEGKANAALRRFLADAFDVPLLAVTIVRGEASRSKTVRIERPIRRPDLDWERTGRA